VVFNFDHIQGIDTANVVFALPIKPIFDNPAESNLIAAVEKILCDEDVWKSSIGRLLACKLSIDKVGTVMVYQRAWYLLGLNVSKGSDCED